MNMYAFYVARGHTLDYLINLDFHEKLFFYCAKENYYQEKSEKI